MSLNEALTMGLSFIELYKKSPLFEGVSKDLDREGLFQKALLDRFDVLCKVLTRR